VQKDFILLDGGLATALEDLGNSFKSELWTGELLKSAPDQILEAHRAFVEAGAEIIITSTYQVSFPGCIAKGWTHTEVVDALKLSVQLAREAGAPKVAASIGPYGAYLADGSEYRGNYDVTEEALIDFHKERLEILIGCNPDYIAFETIPELREARVILNLLKSLNNTIPTWIAFSCKDDLHLSSGELFSDAAKLSKELGADYVGINCTSPELVTSLLESAPEYGPFVVYPNAGKTWNEKLKQLEGSAVKLSDQHIREWVDCGATIIGGCCGIGPKEISEVISFS
jgi:homocysteine S-methyltransferase